LEICYLLYSEIYNNNNNNNNNNNKIIIIIIIIYYGFSLLHIFSLQGLKLRIYFRGQVGPHQINFGSPHNLLGAHQARSAPATSIARKEQKKIEIHLLQDVQATNIPTIC
jgi:hypothetical protein